MDTWAIDAEGDFTHTPSQWLNEAWFRSRYNTEDNANELIFGLLKRKDKNMSTVVYAVYHGRFAEMLLTHFDAKISSIELTSVPDVYDNIY